MTEQEILEKLSEIENAAQSVITSTAEKKAQLQKQADERTKEFDRKVDEESQDRLSETRSSIENDLEHQLQKLKEDTEKASDFLESHYMKELDERADEIVERILS